MADVERGARPISSPSVVEAASGIIQDLVRSALNGASDAELVARLGEGLAEAGLDVPTIEVACDVVDPERAQHVLSWQCGAGMAGGSLRALDIFHAMLEEGLSVLRLGADLTRFAPLSQEGATDALAIATHLEPDATIGFFDDVMTMFATRRPGGFGETEIDLLHRVVPVFGLALGARLNAEAARVLLGTYLGEGAATAMLGGRVGLGAVEQIRAVVVYCDLAGFTSLTEGAEPQALIDTLNLFFETVTRPVLDAGGQVSGHVGDAVVMFLPVSCPESDASRCTSAVSAVVEALKALDRLNEAPARQMAPPLRARVGLDLGEVVHGNVGSAGRFSFTIIGTPVNRAARLQSLAKDLDAAVLMPAVLAEVAGFRGTAFGSHVLRGLERPVEIVGLRATSRPDETA